TAMRCARTGEELQVYGDGSQVRDFLHVRDLTSLCLSTLRTRMPAGAHVFNAASGVPTPIRALLAMVESGSGLPLRLRHVAARAADVKTILVDPTSAQVTFDWQPAVPLRQGLAATWDWFRTQT